MDSEPDVPEAEQQPPAASAARNPDDASESPEAAVTPAGARQTTAKTARPAASKSTPAKRTSSSASTSGTAAKRSPTAKPAARTTATRTTAAKSAAQKSAAPKSTAAGGASQSGDASVDAATAKAPAAAKSPTTAKAAPKTTPKAAPKAAPRTSATRAPAKPRTTSRTAASQGADTPSASTASPTRAKRPAGPARKPDVPTDVVARPVVVETVDEVEVIEVLEVVERPEAASGDEAEAAVTEEDAPAETVRAEAEASETEAAAPREVVLKISGLVKRFDDTTAVAGIDLSIEAGSFFGLVGPNGAGKTTTLSMVTGLLRPDAGTVTVHGADVWSNPVVAKRTMGVLPDRLRLFDRLTGAQLLYYSGILHGLEKSVVRSRSADLAIAFGLEDSLDRLVTDYSAGMTKKVAIAAAMIHSPRLLVLDEPFESVDPVSAANVIEILQKYVSAGGTVVMSSHTMNLIERICDSVAVVVNGAVLATGTMAEVRAGKTLEERFVELAGGRKAAEGMEWLHKFSD